MRFLFFLLLVINAAFAAHQWLNENRSGAEEPSKREINRDALKVVSITDASSAAKTAARVSAAKQLAESLSSAACIEMNGVRPGDAVRAQLAFSAMNLSARISERKIEEASRYWVFMPGAKDRKTADANVAALRKQGIKDASLLGDNSISLGVFSSEDAAARYLAEVQGKGVKGVEKGPRNTQVKEHVFTVRDPDTNLVARLTVMQADFEGSALKAVTCLPEVGATQSNAKAAQR